MKKLEFETSKEKFILVDSVGHENYYEIIRDWIDKGVNVELIALLKDITEEQASEVVELTTMYEKLKVERYKYRSYVDGFLGFETAIESLHSLIKSKGWNLFENPYKNSELFFMGGVSQIDMEIARYKHQRRCLSAEQKTFYNPYLFRVKK